MALLTSALGLAQSSRRYVQIPTDRVKHDEFLAWLNSRGEFRDDSTNAQTLSKRALPIESEPGSHLLSHRAEYSPSEEASHTSLSPHPKRIRTVIRERPPCLRCKILKRKVSRLLLKLLNNTEYIQCDSLQQCAHCPQQSDENESDYWKVLGCLRGSLQELSQVLIPGEL